MDKSQITQTASEAEELYKVVMNLYWSYLNTLEIYVQNTPETETMILSELNKEIQEVQSALNHDIAVFQKAIESDTEGLQGLKDKLKIDSIYENLKNK